MLSRVATSSTGVGYRYGFNGKEDDFGAKGALSPSSQDQLDYGNRIYDPRVGRFLSVDRLTGKYPELSPYQYATDRPVDGVDLDGFEYLSADKARVYISYGNVELNIQNLHEVTRNVLQRAVNDMNNWKPGEAGIDFTMGHIHLESYSKKEEVDLLNGSDNSYTAPEPDFQPGKNDISNKTKEGFTDLRYKKRSVNSATPAGSVKMARISIAIDIAIEAANRLNEYFIDDDKDLIRQHLGIAQKASEDVNQAIQLGMIPEEFLSDKYLSDIANVVLSGVSNLQKDGDEKGAKVLEIGQEIYRKISLQRFKKKEDGSSTKPLKGPSGIIVKPATPLPKTNEKKIENNTSG